MHGDNERNEQKSNDSAEKSDSPLTLPSVPIDPFEDFTKETNAQQDNVELKGNEASKKAENKEPQLTKVDTSSDKADEPNQSSTVSASHHEIPPNEREKLEGNQENASSDSENKEAQSTKADTTTVESTKSKVSASHHQEIHTKRSAACDIL